MLATSWSVEGGAWSEGGGRTGYTSWMLATYHLNIPGTRLPKSPRLRKSLTSAGALLLFSLLHLELESDSLKNFLAQGRIGQFTQVSFQPAFIQGANLIA
jgi:hypothetical protein